MTKTQLAVLRIASDTAIDTIAEKHNSSPYIVRMALDQGIENVCNQYQKLVLAGMETVDNM